ncbi:MAG: hypothetical protein ACRC5C_12530 [Bacilli bacterium]
MDRFPIVMLTTEEQQLLQTLETHMRNETNKPVVLVAYEQVADQE